MSHNENISDEPTPAERQATLAELKRLIRLPLPPVPEQSLELLYEAACHDTGGSQAARSFLFWLAGQPDPTGYAGHGGIEMRRVDHDLKQAALQVLEWWAGLTKSDQPLYETLSKLRSRFSPDETNSSGGDGAGNGN